MTMVDILLLLGSWPNDWTSAAKNAETATSDAIASAASPIGAAARDAAAPCAAC